MRCAAFVASLLLGTTATAQISQTKSGPDDKFRQFEGESWPTPSDYFQRMMVTNDLLGDVYPRQLNQVSVTSGKIVRTFTVTKGDIKTVILR